MAGGSAGQEPCKEGLPRQMTECARKIEKPLKLDRDDITAVLLVDRVLDREAR